MIDQLIARERSKLWHKTFGHLPEIKARRRQTLLKWRKENPCKYLLQLAKARAKEREVIFDLKEEDIIVPDLCPVFKVPFEYGTPMTMSIDRIEPNRGYIKGNIQVISWKANRMKQDASLEELRTFALWVNTLQD